MLPNCRHIAEFLSRTRILLMPSLWYEGFGLTVMEAMLHGIPVIASDAGGLVEAKMGTPFVAHAPAIERYAPVFDEHSLPQPVIGPVDLRPWEDALRALLTDRALYQRVSAASREAALRFAGGLDAGRMPEFLQSLQPGEACGSVPRWRTCHPRSGRCCCGWLAAGSMNAHPAGAKRALLSGVWRRRPFQPFAAGGVGRARPRMPRGGAHRPLWRRRARAISARTGGARGFAAGLRRRRGGVSPRGGGGARGHASSQSAGLLLGADCGVRSPMRS
jgi:hypothetical protein